MRVSYRSPLSLQQSRHHESLSRQYPKSIFSPHNSIYDDHLAIGLAKDAATPDVANPANPSSSTQTFPSACCIATESWTAVSLELDTHWLQLARSLQTARQ